MYHFTPSKAEMQGFTGSERDREEFVEEEGVKDNKERVFRRTRNGD